MRNAAAAKKTGKCFLINGHRRYFSAERIY